MGKRNKYGAYIDGITEMNDRKFFEIYIKEKHWDKANYWLDIEIAFLRNKVVRQRILYNVFGLLMSFVMAFLSWVYLYPSGDPKELEAFPLATICNNIYIKLCEAVPYEKPAEIVGLILMPFAVCLVLGVALIVLGEIIYKLKCKRYRANREGGSASAVKAKIEKLGKLYDKYDNEYLFLLLYALFAGIFTGGVMIFSSVPAGLNLFEYVIIGVVLDVIYGLVFLAVSYVVHFFKDQFGVESYNTFYWARTVGRALGETYYSYDDTNDDNSDDGEFIPDEATIQKILDDVYSAFENTGIGKDL
ncbi:MAG: hypothetical protein IIX54_06580 [Clostridia bacterium]|nr:hypothetical protein [Clostridia bacterium]